MTGYYKSHVIIDLNSEVRTTGTIEKPVFKLDHQIKFSQSPTKSYYMRLENTLIPKTFYDIDSTNNIFRVLEDGTPLIITIDPGNYTITELLTQLEADLDSDTTDGNAYTLTYDDITDKVSFEVVFGAIGPVIIDSIANGSTLSELLGFGKTSYGLIDNQTTLVDSVASEATYVVDLDTKSYISVETNITSANYYDTSNQKHIGVIVPINVDRNEKQWFENTTGHMTLLNNKGPFNSVKLHLKDEYGFTMGLNGAHWSTTMCIYELTEIQKI